MPSNVPTQTAAQWAATVSRRGFRRHRDRLDELILETVPAYRASVTSILDDFANAVRSERDRYDVEHDVARLLRPWKANWAKLALFWVSLLGCITAVAMMIASGGTSIDFGDIDWTLMAPLASVAYTLGVAAHLAGTLPLVRGIPPKSGLSWLPPVCGLIVVAAEANLVRADLGISPAWLAISIVAFVVSAIYFVLQRLSRSKNRDLAREADSLEEKRLVANGDRIELQADEYADRIEAAFHALPSADQRKITLQLAAATDILRERMIIRTPAPAEVGYIRQRIHRHYRPMVVGMLMLEKRVQREWDSSFSEPRTRRPVHWSLYEYTPPSRRTRARARRN